MTLSKFIIDVDEETFEKEVLLRSHEVPVVVDFWAAWCGPCRTLGPMLERAAIEAGGDFLLAKVDVDQNPGLSIRYGIQGIPAVKGFRNGEKVKEFVGAQPESIVQQFLKDLIPNSTDQKSEEARALLGTRHWKDAEAAFRQVLVENETDGEAALGLAQSLLMQGFGKEVLEMLKNFPPGAAWVEAERLRPLAILLEEIENGEVAFDEDSLNASLHQAARLIKLGNLPAALDGFLDILKQDKRFRDGLPKDVMLALFVLMGDEDPETRRYRDELASVLF